MQAPFSCELFATRLSDPKLTATLKTKIALELRDSPEIFQVAENSKQLDVLIPALLGLLDKEPPSFSPKAYEQKLRCTLLEIFNRLPFTDSLKGQVNNIARTLLHLLRIDNEENAIASLKILVDLIRHYKGLLEVEIVTLHEILRDIYANMDQTVRDCFDSSGTPASTSGNLALGSPRPSSPGSELTDGSQKPLAKGMSSFKLLIDCPSILKPFTQSHKEQLSSLVQIMFPAALEFLKVQAAPQLEAHQLERAKGELFIGVSPALKNRTAFSDFVVAQIKTMVYLAVLYKGGHLNFVPYLGQIFEVIVRLLCDCPPDFSSVRKDLFFTITYIICAETRPYFLNQLDLFLNERIMGWSGVTSKETLKYFSYSVVAEIIHYIRSDLNFDQISRVVYLFIRGLHDPHLSFSMQLGCVKLLVNVIDIISKAPDPKKSRLLLMHILDAFANKVDSINQVLPSIRKQHLESDPPKPFPSIATLGPDNIENFDFEKMRPLVSLVKSPQNPTDLLRDARTIFRNIFCSIETLMRGLTLTNPKEESIKDCAAGFSNEDTQLFARLFRDALKCLSLFQLDRTKEPSPPPLKIRDGSALSFDSPDAREIIRTLVFMLHSLDLAVFYEVITTHVDFFFEQFLENPLLGLLPQYLLASERLSCHYVSILLNFLIERLPQLGSRDGHYCTRFLKLFTLVFQAVSHQPNASEHLLLPLLPTILRKCFDYPPQSTEATHYYLLLNVLYNHLSLSIQEKIHSDLSVHFPQMISELLLALATSQDDVRELLIDLLLSISITFSCSVSFSKKFLTPICLALNGPTKLANKGLRALEIALDKMTSDSLDQILSTKADEIVYGVGKHIKPFPQDAVLTGLALRVLGKLGKVSQVFLQHAPHALPDASLLDGCEFSAMFEFEGRPQAFALHIRKFIVLAQNVLEDSSSELLYKQKAFHLVKGCLGLTMNIESLASADIMMLRKKASEILTNASDEVLSTGGEIRFMLPVPSIEGPYKLEEPVAASKQRDSSGDSLKKIVSAIFLAATIPELHGEAWKLLEGLMAHLALIKVTECLDSVPEMAANFPERMVNSINPDMIIEALVASITALNPKLRQLGLTALIHLEKSCKLILGGRELLSRLPLFSQICEQLCSCCYMEDWFRKERACFGLTLLVTRLELDRVWLLRQESRIVASLVYVIKSTSSTATTSSLYELVWQALQQIITKTHEGLESNDQMPGIIRLVGQVLAELFSANASLRQAIKSVLNLCIKLAGIDLPSLLGHFATRLQELMFVRPMRSLSTPLMVGAFDAITFILDTRPGFIRVEEHLPTFAAECLALLDTDDSLFQASEVQDERTKTRFRVKCITVMMSALAFAEHLNQPGLLRGKTIRVFFKFLHADAQEVADSASQGLKVLLAQQAKLPKDLLQEVLKPYLTSISDYNLVTLPHLKGLSRLLDILTHYFKIEIGSKLFEGMRHRAQASLLKEAACTYLPDQSEIKLITAILNIFQFLPPIGSIFLKDLIPATIEMEHHLRRNVASPFRTPLIQFLNKYPPEAIQYFYDHLHEERYVHFLVSLLNTENAGALRKEIITHPEALINHTLDKGDDLNFHFICIARACCRYQPDWLTRVPSVLDRLVTLWRAPERLERLKHEAQLGLTRIRESYFLSQLFMVAISQDPTKVGLVFEVATVLASTTVMDFSTLRSFFRNLAHRSAPAQRRDILVYFLKLLGEPSVPPSHLAIYLHHLVNPMLLVACVRNNQASVIDADIIRVIHSKVWDTPDPNQMKNDYLKLELIQLTSLLLQYVPDMISEFRKEIIQFGIAGGRLDDMICRQASHLLVARFIAAYPTPDNIIIHVYGALLKANILETKLLVRHALDAIVSVLPTRPSRTGEDPRFPLWIRFTKQSLGEEVYNIPHVINIFLLISRHPKIFFDYRKHFLPQMVYMLPKLGFTNNATDSKSLIVQLSDLIHKWEVLRLDGTACLEPTSAETGSKRSPNPLPTEEMGSIKKTKGPAGQPVILDPAKDFVITSLMKEITLTTLIKLFCSCEDPPSRKTVGIPALAAFKSLISLPSWSDAAIPLGLFDDALKLPDGTVTDDNQLTITFNLELLMVLITNRPVSWLVGHIKQIKDCLSPCIRANIYPIACCLFPIIHHIFTVLSNPGSTSYEQEMSQFQRTIEECILKGLSDSSTLGSALILLDAIGSPQPDLVDSFFPTLVRLFQKLAKEHTGAIGNNNPVDNKISSKLVQWRSAYPTISSSESITSKDSAVNSILRGLSILQRRIAHLGDLRKTLLSGMGLLLEKSHDCNLLRNIFELVSNWVLSPKEPLPTTKEKANLLVCMIEMESRCDASLLADYLDLIYAIYSDPMWKHSELTVKLESAFMLGTRSEIPQTRLKFLALMDRSIPRPLPLRLKYILGVHDWERLSTHCWIPQATYLLIGAIKLNLGLKAAPPQIRLPCPSKVFLPHHRRDPELSELHSGVEFESATEICRQLDALNDIINSLIAEDILLPMQTLSYVEPDFQIDLWANLFSRAWGLLTELEQSELLKIVIDMLAKPYHLKQVLARPNVIQALLSGVEKCRPAIVLPPQLVKYLGSKYNAWHVAIQILENSLVVIDTNPEKDDVLIRGSVEDSLCDLFTQLGEDEMLCGLWSRRAKYPATNVALALSQQGQFDQAQVAWEGAQSLTNKGVLSSCEAEYCLWEEQWIQCAEKLQQWDVLEELAEANNCRELKLRAQWQSMGWTNDTAPFNDCLAQFDVLEANPKFAPQLQLYYALSSLGRTPDSMSEAIDEFNIQAKKSAQAIVVRWHSLPSKATPAHLDLLGCCQQLIEAEMAPTLLSQLSEMDSPGAAISCVEKFLSLWRARLPRSFDSVSHWAGLVGWRLQFFSTLVKFIQARADNFIIKEEKASVGRLLQVTHHEQACLLLEFSRAARKQHQYSTSTALLSKLYNLSNLHISDAFIKIIEQTKCYIALPNDLDKGLSMLKKFNLGHFSAQQKVKYYMLKGRFLTKLGHYEEANISFSTATQFDMGLAKNWAVWGMYNEKMFLLHRDKVEFGVYAINCYTQASAIYKNRKSRRYIAKVIYLLNLDDNLGTLANAFENHKADLPLWYWLFFVPQLLNAMTQRSSHLFSAILFQLAKWYPQAIYFDLLTAREEYAVLRTLAKPTSANDGEDVGGEVDVYKQAWDILSDITDSIKVNVPLFSRTAVIFTEALTNYPKPGVAENMYQLLNGLCAEAINQLCNQLGSQQTPEQLLPPRQFPRLLNYLKYMPPGTARSAFEECFVRNPLSLLDLVTRLRKWRDRFELLLPQLPNRVFLDSFSPNMLNAEASSLNDILVPGQYNSLDGETRELVKVSRFLPRVEIIHRHNIAYHKLSIRGHNGEIYSFLLQNGATYISRREERFCQLAHCMNETFSENGEAVRRQLKFHLPNLIPMGHSLRMIEYKGQYASLYEMYEDHCHRNAIPRDQPFLHYFNRLQEATTNKSKQPQQCPVEALNLRMEIMNEISQSVAPPSMVTSYLMRNIDNYTDWWKIRAHLVSQLSLMTVLTYSMVMGGRQPTLMLFSIHTGELWLQEAVPTLNSTTPTFQHTDLVPFRLTPNLQHLISRRNLGGPFVGAIVAAARALSDETAGAKFEGFLPLFMREEYLFWVTFRQTLLSDGINSHKLDPTIDPLKDSHDSVVNLVEAVNSKIKLLACHNQLQLSLPTEKDKGLNKAPVNQPVLELISYATNSVKLAQMDYSWMPWL